MAKKKKSPPKYNRTSQHPQYRSKWFRINFNWVMLHPQNYPAVSFGCCIMDMWFLDRFRFHVSAIIHLKDDVFKPSIYRNCRCVNISVGPLSENIKVWRSHLPTLPYLFIFYIVVYYQRNHSSVFSLLITLKCSTLTATTYSINIPSYPDLCLIFAFFFIWCQLCVSHFSYKYPHICTGALLLCQLL